MTARIALVVALASCPARVSPPALCGGVDDTVALQRALDRERRVVLPAGGVCRFAQLTIRRAVTLELAGATLAVVPGAGPGPYLRVLGDGVAIRGGAIDGGGAPGWLVDWRGGAGELDRVIVQRGGSIGLSVSGGALSARRVVARDFAGATGIGVRVGAGALRAEAVGAEGCRYAGIFVSQDAPGDTVLDAWTARNGIGVAVESPRGGRIARLVSRDDDRFGLLLDRGASDWRIGRVRVEVPGRSAHNRSGTGVELFARNHRNTFDDIEVLGAAGYGFAIAGGSHDNQIARLVLDARGAWDGDPGLVIAGGSHRNRVAQARVLGHTIGVRIGENDLATDASNDGNWIGALYVTGARYNAIRIERGRANTIEDATIADSDSSGSDREGFSGLVYFGNDSSGNRIGALVQADARRVPGYIVYAGPCAAATCLPGAVPADNRVERITAVGWSIALRHGVSP